MASLTFQMTIYLAKKAQIVFFIIKKVLILIKYLDHIAIFL